MLDPARQSLDPLGPEASNPASMDRGLGAAGPVGARGAARGRAPPALTPGA